MNIRRVLFAFFSAAVLVPVAACSPSKKTQCEQLNAAMAPIEGEKSVPPAFGFLAERTAYAGKLEAVADKIDGLKITDPALVPAVRTYSETARALAGGYKQENLLSAAGLVSAKSVELANAYGKIVETCGPMNPPTNGSSKK
jgi:hypothetical protein